MKAAFVLTGAAFLAAGAYALATSTTGDDLLISEAFAKPLQTGGGVAILKIDNSGTPDRLLGVSSPVADVALYAPVTGKGLPVPSNTAASLAFDAAHITIGTSEKPLQDGTLLPLTLTFAEAGEVKAKARVSAPVDADALNTTGLFGLGDICVVGEGEPAPAIGLSVTQEGDIWRVRVETADFTFSKDLLGLYHVPGMGHGHLYVGGMKLERMFSEEVVIGALPSGEHEIRVTLNTNDHRAYVVNDMPVTANARIIVD